MFVPNVWHKEKNAEKEEREGFTDIRRVGVAQSVSRRAAGWTARLRFPAVQDFSLLHSVQTGSGAHLASYPIGTGSSFLRG
jgi:hypothetical protein